MSSDRSILGHVAYPELPPLSWLLKPPDAEEFGVAGEPIHRGGEAYPSLRFLSMVVTLSRWAQTRRVTRSKDRSSGPDSRRITRPTGRRVAGSGYLKNRCGPGVNAAPGVGSGGRVGTKW